MGVQSSIKSGEYATNLNFFLIESLYLPHDGKNTQKNRTIFLVPEIAKNRFARYLYRFSNEI